MLTINEIIDAINRIKESPFIDIITKYIDEIGGSFSVRHIKYYYNYILTLQNNTTLIEELNSVIKHDADIITLNNAKKQVCIEVVEYIREFLLNLDNMRREIIDQYLVEIAISNEYFEAINGR